MLLGNYFHNINKNYKNFSFSGVSFDTQNIKKNHIFFAIKGNNFDGNEFIPIAIKKGSKIIVTERKVHQFQNGILFIRTKNVRKLLAEISFKIYNKNPKNLIAVTGTNGKSSVADFYYQILKLNNKKAASIGTLGVKSKIGYDKARKLAFAPHINIGVFSLQKESKGWKVWQNNLSKTLKSGNIFGSEGLAINMSVYIDDLETEFLPLYCNWITSNLLPKYDEKENTFVEPFLPNYKIGIMHLAAGIWKDGKDMRIDKSVKIEIETLNNNKLSKTLRFEK